MTYCQSYAKSMFFEPDWLERLLKDCNREGLDYRNVMLLNQESRSAVWNVCGMLGCLGRGLPGQACRLVELYLHKLLRSHGNISDYVIQRVLIENIMPRFPLIIACCAQLAAKMNSASNCNSVILIRVALLAKGISYTTQEIVFTEADIFRALDFRLPLWTGVDMGELLAARLKLPIGVIIKVALIVDFAEYYQKDIVEELLWVANLLNTTQNARYVRTLHLSAGAVAAAVRLFTYRADPAPTLARLLRIPLSYFKCLCDIILKRWLAHPNVAITLKGNF